MKVNRHTEVALVALSAQLPMPASVILGRLAQMAAPSASTALEVCRMTMSRGAASSSNGDSVIVVIRDGIAVTAMLRRSWNQPFTVEALRVEAVASWAWKFHAPDGHNAGKGEWVA